MATYKKQKWLLDGDIMIFVLATARSDKWQVRFKNPLKGGASYVRKSLGTRNESLAISKAVELYNEYNSRSLLKLKTEHTTLRDLLDDARYKMDQMDPVSLKTANSFYNTYWSKFFGDKDISVITSDDISDYFDWRINSTNESRPTSKSHWRPSATTISASTLKLERNILRQLLRIGVQKNLILRIPDFPKRFDRLEGVHKLPSNKRRGRFDRETQYNKILSPDFTSISLNLQSERSKPSLQHIISPFHPEFNPYLSVSKHAGQRAWKKREDTKRWRVFCKKRPRYASATYWFISLLISNCGVRPAEAVRLRHRDIRLVEDANGKKYTIINVREQVAKTGKQRFAVCSDLHKTYERYLIYRDELTYYFNQLLDDDDFIFPSIKKETFYVQHRTDIDNCIRPHLQRLNLHRGFVETKDYGSVAVFFSLYSFRAFFITTRLSEGLDIYTLSKCVGSSIKTIAAAYDYNETWAFREAITSHLRGDWDTSDTSHLDSHSTPWFKGV